MSGVCGVSVGTGAVRIAYIADGRRVEDSIDAAGAHDLLPGKLVDHGPFEDIVLAGWDTAAVTALLDTLGDRTVPKARMVEESQALMAYARTVPELADKDYVLVVDLGKKGLSATALDVAGDYIEWTARTVDISGDRFDEVVRGIVMAKGILPAPVGPEGDEEYQAFFRELKELVSSSAGVRAPNRGPMLLSRKEFEREITPLVSDALDWASKQAPDAVLLIGGGAAIPAVRTIIEDKWNVPVHVPDAPAMAIAKGAALDERPVLGAAVDTDVPDAGVLEAGVLDADVLDADVGIITVPDDASELLDAPGTTDFGAVDEWMVDGLTVDQLATEELAITSTVFDAAAADTSVIGPAVVEPAVEQPEVLEPDVVTQPARRTTRWSVRDASVLAAVALVIVAVAGLVFTRGNTPAPTPLIDEQIPVDAGFAAALADAAGPAEDAAPGPAELPVQGPVRLSDADLYERAFTYDGELYRPDIGSELPE
ncbi:hypothetical protein BH93_23420 [Rhodococcoides fascians A25f]|uniref:hypothetical protein n=1 Tax=Rhodococcoides fascians TaxID=1828 RepID=UPI0012D31A1D|nr:hypothetical protein [Rhodococcus fascians]QII07938.1 hypothetical protein BH93_23420 [Rhodococcus fascians A25f]